MNGTAMSSKDQNVVYRHLGRLAGHEGEAACTVYAVGGD